MSGSLGRFELPSGGAARAEACRTGALGTGFGLHQSGEATAR
jgi:hypothetical protein